METNLENFLGAERIAFFSMELGLNDDIHTYSGGLGILAGDILRASADLRLPLIGVTLASRKGYIRQEITEEGSQIEHSQDWDPSEFMELVPEEVEINICNRNMKIKSWLYTVKSITKGETPVLFLDTDVRGNSEEDRKITHFLYGGDDRYRLKQEMVLGIGGVRILEALGFKVRRYHMNEGHSSLLGLELLRKYDMDLKKVKDICVFTTHTPVEAGHDKFPYSIVKNTLGEFIPLQTMRELGGKNRLNMTRLALNLSNYINGVAKEHRETSMKMFPGYKIHAITNGVHSHTWTCESFRHIYDKYLPGWAIEPSILARVDIIPDEEIWEAHKRAKKRLVEYIRKGTDINFDPDRLTIGLARRATEYKRPNLIFSDRDKLRKVNRRGEIQLVFGGKAHPKDEGGKKVIKDIFNYMEMLGDEIKIVYLQNYDMSVATTLIPGVDVWLNTPLPPLEASGTSGMKAAHNGVVNFSVLDGWWIEGCIEGITGWAIGPNPDEKVSDEQRRIRELDDLYNKLEYLIIPLFYKRRDDWIRMMKNSIGELAYYFNSHRMLLRYVIEAYF